MRVEGGSLSELCVRETQYIAVKQNMTSKFIKIYKENIYNRNYIL